MTDNLNKMSWRHHYIPQFYLNGFTSDNEKFKVFDVIEKKFIKNGMDFSTRSYFFEENGNTIFKNNQGDDFIEEFYKEFDSKVAEVFNRINNASSENQYNINNDDIALLQYFIGLMHWRVPSNFQKIEEITNNKDFKSLGLSLRNNKGERIIDLEAENKIKNNPNFYKAMKFWFASISYPELFNCKTPLHISPFPKGLPCICSDNPIICRNPDTFQVYTDDFIFPLNSTLAFIRGEKIIDHMSTVRIEMDLLIYKQAKKYVSCTDIRYLEMLDACLKKAIKTWMI